MAASLDRVILIGLDTPISLLGTPDNLNKTLRISPFPDLLFKNDGERFSASLICKWSDGTTIQTNCDISKYEWLLFRPVECAINKAVGKDIDFLISHIVDINPIEEAFNQRVERILNSCNDSSSLDHRFLRLLKENVLLEFRSLKNNNLLQFIDDKFAGQMRKPPDNVFDVLTRADILTAKSLFKKIPDKKIVGLLRKYSPCYVYDTYQAQYVIDILSLNSSNGDNKKHTEQCR